MKRLAAVTLPLALVAVGCSALFPAPTAPKHCPLVQVDSIPVVRATAPHDTVSWSPVLREKCS